MRRSLEPATAGPPLPLSLASTDITESFVGQLAAAIVSVPSHHAGGMSPDRTHVALARTVGVSLTATRAVVDTLVAMGLVTESSGVLGRSTAGDRVRRQVRDSGTHHLAVSLLRSGLMADQIRVLRRVLQRDGHVYVCGRTTARSTAPQLVGLLARMPDVALGSRLVIGSETALELDSVWNEFPPSSRVNWADLDKRKRAVGERAEMYSVQLERSRQFGAIERINWVSRDDDGLGYDIEVVRPTTDRTATRAGRIGQRVAVASSGPVGQGGPVAKRLIEVKGSAGPDVHFLLSSSEYKVAGREGDAYEVQFWGRINLRRDPAVEYGALLEAGYPIVIVNPVVQLASPPWNIEAALYRVTRPRS